MSIKEQISRGVADALIKLGFKAAASDKPAPEISNTPAAGAITAEIQEAITSAVTTAVAAQITPLQSQLSQAQQDLTNSNTEVSRLKTELQTATDKAATAEKASADLKADFDKKVSASVAETAAAQGLPAPLPVKTGDANPAKPETKPELKGLAKVQAAIKAEISKK